MGIGSSRALSLVCVALSLGCAGSDSPPVGPEEPDTLPEVASIEIVPSQLYMDSLNFTDFGFARAYDSEGNQLFHSVERPDRFAWISSDSTVASVDQFGSTTSRNWGTATITATVPGVTPVSRWVHVADAVDPAWSVPLATGATDSGITVGRDGHIYVGSSDYTLDTTTWFAVTSDGAVVWSLELPLSSRTTPAIAPDGTLYIESRTNRPFHGRLFAIDPVGTIRWTLETDPYDFNLNPAIGPDGTIYTAGGDRVTAISPEGEVKWTFLIDDTDFQASSPAVAADGTIYIGSFNGLLYAINPDGSLRWTFEADDWIGSSPVVGADGTVYFGCADGQLYAVDREGFKRWSVIIDPRPHGLRSAPSIGPDGTIYVNGGDTFAVDPAGFIRWRVEGRYQVTSPVIGADGTIYVAGWNDVLALNPQGKLLWKILVPDPSIDAYPSIMTSPAIGANGQILVGTHRLEGTVLSAPYLRAFTHNENGNGGFDGAFWPTARGNRSNSGRAGG